MDPLASAAGARPGLRVSHAGAISLASAFTQSVRGGGLTRAAHMQIRTRACSESVLRRTGVPRHDRLR